MILFMISHKYIFCWIQEELVAFQEDLEHEQYELHQNALKLSRQAATVSSEKYQDVQV